MKRLIQKGLMFGNLVEVSSPALIERYNRALEHLAGKRTELDRFSHRHFRLLARDRG